MADQVRGRAPERLGPWILNCFAGVSGVLALWILNDMRTSLRSIEFELSRTTQRVVALETWRSEHATREPDRTLGADVIIDDDPSTPP